MASSLTPSIHDDCEPCVLCSSKHNRTRPSFCQCKHCSIPLCLDCMKEHHDEVLQNVTQLSHQYNELQELMQTKKKTIDEEAAKSVQHVNRYFDTYINELRETQHKIVEDIGRSKQNAQSYVVKMDSDLHSLGIDIQSLAKERIVQTARMNNLSTAMKRFEKQVNTYHATVTENLIKTKPEFSLKFDCSSDVLGDASQPLAIVTKQVCQLDTKEPSSEISLLNTLLQPATGGNALFQTQEVDRRHNEDSDYSVSNDDDDGSSMDDDQMPTSYSIDRMASDGENVLYTSYVNEDPDLIAYCYMNDDDGNADQFRDWKQARIKDMIWWSNINKFICATENAIYTVDYANGKFKILRVLPGNWSQIYVAANTNNMFLHYITDTDQINEIEVYTPDFRLVKLFNVSDHRILSTSSSFCVTNRMLASICTRMQNNRQVFQVNFFDLEMNQLKKIRLGICDDSIEIRSDGNELFFITTGRRKLHIISANGKKKTFTLKDNGDCIAVLNNRRIAVSKQRTDMELIIY